MNPTNTTGTNAPAAISFAAALRFWIKLGFISFGGPAGQIAIMHQELVERRCWISEKRFLHALNYCMVLPGPEAQQLATYIGWLMHKTRGGIAAGVLFVLPSLFMLIALSWIYMAFGHLPVIAGVFYGIKPAVTAIVLQATHRIGRRVLNNAALWLIAALAFTAIFAFDVPFPLIVIAAALLGIIGGRLAPQRFQTGSNHSTHAKQGATALIDDNTPTPEHARHSRRRLIVLIGVGAALWLLPMSLLCAVYGWHGALPQIGWFFTKAALMTFGGAYAVLPYVFQGAVDHYQWLTPTQMIDGLALGETTPGPLIMVVAFVGFIAGWAQDIGGDMPFLAGAIGAIAAAWFTFLPSFVFILAGGPLVESTHNALKFTAPLTAITAAVVGVIVNLALFFAYHVWWSHGFDGAFEWQSALITLAAAVALLHCKRHVIEVIGFCALLGLLLQMSA